MSESSNTSSPEEGAFDISESEGSPKRGRLERTSYFDEINPEDTTETKDDDRTFREAASSLACSIAAGNIDTKSIRNVVKELPSLSRLLVGYEDRMEQDPERDVWPKYKPAIDMAILRVLDASARHCDFDLISASQMALLDLCPALPADLLEEKVVPSLLDSIGKFSAQASKINAVILFAEMVKSAIEPDSEQQERIVLEALDFLANHPSSDVRKALALNFTQFCYSNGRPSKEKMVPSFLKLCRDEDWEVRRRAVENFCHFSSTVSKETRRSTLAPAFIQLLEDEDVYVSVPALMVLGPFIALFSEDNLFDERIFLYHPDAIDANPLNSAYTIVKAQHDQGIGIDRSIEAHITSMVPLYYFMRWPPKWISSNIFDNIFREAPSDEEVVLENQKNSVVIRALNSLKVTLDRILMGEELGEEAVETDNDSIGVSEDESIATQPADSEDASEKSEPISTPEPSKPEPNLFWPSYCRTKEKEEPPKKWCDGVSPLPAEEVGGGDAGDAIMVIGRGSDLIDGELVVLDGGDADEPAGLDESFVEDSADGFDSGVEDGGEDEIIDHLNKADEKKVNNDIVQDDFNTFQYWRDPMPDIEDELKEKLAQSDRQSSRPSYSEVSQAMVAQDISLRPAKLFPPPKKPSPKNHWPKDVFEYIEDDLSSLYKKKKAATNECDDERQTMWDSLSPSLSNSSGQNVVPDGLLRSFVNMANRRPSLTYFCAFSFPSVAKTLGVQYWPALKAVYETLANANHWKTRRTAASYIHELAEFLRDEPASDDLISVFHGFMKDIDEVRSAVLSHLSEFIRCLKPASRSEVLPLISRFLDLDNDRDWRFREALAKQVLQLVGLFPPSCTCLHLSPIVMSLLCDRVWEVRKNALQLATELVSHVSIDVCLQRNLLSELAEQLAHSTQWRRRQTFVLCCSRLITESVLSYSMFTRDVLPHLLDLSWDPVPNVRITVARTLVSDLVNPSYFSSSKSYSQILLSVMYRLIIDDDKDVQEFARQVGIKYRGEAEMFVSRTFNDRAALVNEPGRCNVRARLSALKPPTPQ